MEEFAGQCGLLQALASSKHTKRHGKSAVNHFPAKAMDVHSFFCWNLEWQDIFGTTIYPLVNQHNYGKSPCLMGKSTISMAIFKFANCNSLPGRVSSLFHPFYPHLGRCFASEIRSRDLFDFRFQKVAESGDCLNFQRDFWTFWVLGKVMPEGENHKSEWFSHQFFMILRNSSCIPMLLGFISSFLGVQKKMPFFDGPNSPAPSQLSRVLSFFQLQSLRMGSIGSVWIIWGTRNGGVPWKKWGYPLVN